MPKAVTAVSVADFFAKYGEKLTAELIAGRMAAPGRATIARYMIEEWLGREL